MSLPTFVALRYLRPRRGRGLVSVVSAIAIGSFAVGVGSLILALAITSGFRDALQTELVGATAQVNLLRQERAGIANYPPLLDRLRRLPHVTAVAPVVYEEAFLSRPGGPGAGATLKGVLPRQELQIGSILNHIVAGGWGPLAQNPAAPNLVLGKDLADSLGAAVGDTVNVYVPDAVLTPLGMAGGSYPFTVAGIFQSGFMDFDSVWAYAGLAAVQHLQPDSGADWASDIEFHLDDIYQADAVAAAARAAAGPGFATATWISQNRPIFQALQLERLGTLLVIGLVVLVAALNVLIMLTMLVMEKRKEIAVLLGMGARRSQIRRIFVLQGLWIAALGTLLGLAIAYPLAWGANQYHWLHVSAAVYAVDYIPFHARARDGLLVAALALAISYAATLYPARRATAVLPAETLRYE